MTILRIWLVSAPCVQRMTLPCIVCLSCASSACSKSVIKHLQEGFEIKDGIDDVTLFLHFPQSCWKVKPLCVHDIGNSRRTCTVCSCQAMHHHIVAFM
mmetsp:Transcript_114479/g.334697  ORF Transcript_114479/g.334697 Transcript_114479/m.334697 type:complete len:98 (-) Transcript_114479:416-709(-)